MSPEGRRARAIARAQQALERHAYPRLEMFVIVAATGGVGFLASFLLLYGGMERMWLRYPVALLIAYLFFLVLLWLWMRLRRDSALDAVDPGYAGSGGDAGATEASLEGGGGSFGGAGASGKFEAPARLTPFEKAEATTDIGALALEADAGCLPVLAATLVIAVAGSLLFAAFYIVLGAPTLLAELVVDGVLSYTLYRKLRRDDDPHWLATAIRHTIGAFAVAAVFLAAAGATMAHLAPGARSIGEFMQAQSTRQR